jgi:hypothetical protein
MLSKEERMENQYSQLLLLGHYDFLICQKTLHLFSAANSVTAPPTPFDPRPANTKPTLASTPRSPQPGVPPQQASVPNAKSTHRASEPSEGTTGGFHRPKFPEFPARWTTILLVTLRFPFAGYPVHENRLEAHWALFRLKNPSRHPQALYPALVASSPSTLLPPPAEQSKEGEEKIPTSMRIELTPFSTSSAEISSPFSSSSALLVPPTKGAYDPTMAYEPLFPQYHLNPIPLSTSEFWEETPFFISCATAGGVASVQGIEYWTKMGADPTARYHPPARSYPLFNNRYFRRKKEENEEDKEGEKEKAKEGEEKKYNKEKGIEEKGKEQEQNGKEGDMIVEKKEQEEKEEEKQKNEESGTKEKIEEEEKDDDDETKKEKEEEKGLEELKQW